MQNLSVQQNCTAKLRRYKPTRSFAACSKTACSFAAQKNCKPKLRCSFSACSFAACSKTAQKNCTSMNRVQQNCSVCAAKLQEYKPALRRKLRICVTVTLFMFSCALVCSVLCVWHPLVHPQP